MALRNPMSGGPDYAAVLRNALESKPGTYMAPPSSGGEQVSIRLPEHTAAIIAAITARCQRPEWNRSQVLNALIDRGLFDLFNLLSDKAAKDIMSDIESKKAPPFDPYAGVADRLREFNRYRLYPAIQERHPSGLFGEVDLTWTSARINETSGDIELSGDGWSLRLHVSHLVELVRDTARDAQDGFKNVYLELNVSVIRKVRGFVTVPLRPTALEQSKSLEQKRTRKT
jgi:hypothetical protein